MSNNGIVEHRKDYFYVEFREEYLIICMNCKYKKPVKEDAKCKASPHCKALILAILERWTDDKRKKGEYLAIYMTYPQWVEAMYSMFGRNVIIDSLDELLGEGLISREKHKMYGKDTYKYLLNYKELNRRIKLLPQGKAFTNKREETTDAFTNQSDAFTNKRDTGLQVNEDAFKSKHNIEPTEIPNKTSTERKNGAATTNSTTEGSHSSTQSSPLVEFAEEEERVYELAKKLKLSFLKKNEKNKAHCAKLLSEGVTTLEQMESLIQFCRQRPYLVGKDLNLGNLAGELDSWLQVQQSQVQGRVLSSYDDPDYVDDTFYVTRVTDEELAEDVRDKVHAFREDDRFDLYLQEIKQIKVQFGLTNFDLCNLMANTCRKVTPENSGMDDFIHEMQRLMY